MASAPASVTQLRRAGEALADPLPPLAVEAQTIAATVALGVHGRRRIGLGETFWEYRHHRHEDDATRIDWRRSAQGDHLYVRENEHEAAQTVFLWRDGRPDMEVVHQRGRPTKKDRAAVILIALASLLTRGGERVGVLGESAMARSGRTGFVRVSQRLADGPGLVEAITPAHMARYARLVLASDFYEPPEIWRERIAALSSRGAPGALVQVVDPEEEEFPFEGRAILQRPAGGPERLFGRVQSLRSAYRERFLAHRAALADLARSVGWTFVATRTDQSAAPTLLRLFTALSPERI